ncbi:MAG TPA: hypothetical protein DFI00_02535 [Rhodospirillaceae bacterium]|nr:hypothetical protein [Alphaproteobacteria bacterium]OUT41942.1 MAG: hypothetical protein CBB62_06445 [Micavibrio sp. TMED2]HCI46150.1 hypothetical protein [Rhodospirillaceae bacterium]MAS46462.1 hypothetical protein [Alphaproteobacteria bacterium]MAX94557.1 hypothetical protein [Alphaproteobacteria bacterium]|tara:strand:+ start:207 stop:908 length:702 start_codon:yes stop_codon:yes gene_type:complete
MNAQPRFQPASRGKRWPDLCLASGRVLYPQHDTAPLGNRLFGPADVARHLSAFPWNPATGLTFTMAEFSVLVAAELHMASNNPMLALMGLLSDAGRIFTGPVIPGVREFIDGSKNGGLLTDLERRLHALAHTACKIPMATPDEGKAIKTAIKAVAARAFRDLMPAPIGAGFGLSGTKHPPRGPIIKPRSADRAHDQFLERWNYYAIPAGAELYGDIEARLATPDATHNQWWTQ